MNQGLIGQQQVKEKEEYDIKETGVKMGDHIFYTDIHWYNFYIRRCYNTKECVVQDIYLSGRVVPNILYKIYYSLLGNWGMWGKATFGPLWNIGLRLFFLMLFANEIFFFFVWQEVEGSVRIVILLGAMIFLAMSIPCLVLRRKAIEEAKKNDSLLPYNQQFSRMILVNRCADPNMTNEFYEVTISKYYEILTSVGIQMENAKMFAASLTQVQTGQNVVKFMIYKPLYREICDEAHSSLTSPFSFLNLQFTLMPLYQIAVILIWIICFMYFGWDTNVPNKK